MSLTAESAAQHDVRIAAGSGKRLTFQPGSEEFGLDILMVREIMGLMDITRVLTGGDGSALATRGR